MWVEWGKSFGELRDVSTYDDLVGMVVEIGGEPILIGMVNTMGGGCDDCADIRREHIIDRYKKIDWESLL